MDVTVGELSEVCVDEILADSDGEDDNEHDSEADFCWLDVCSDEYERISVVD
jgi:hypothetical protein